MSNLIFAIGVSIDGCCDHAKFNPDDEVLDYFTGLTREADVLVYGRKTYELMVPYWPDVAKNQSGQSKGAIEFAQAFVSVPRIIVFSKSLDSVEEKNTTIVHGKIQDEIRKLKQEQGGTILTGGVTLPSELIELGLVDEIRLVVHPIVVGKGRRLFDGLNLQGASQFKLAESKTFKSGCVALAFRHSLTER
jgi:dihydrofolate reductase